MSQATAKRPVSESALASSQRMRVAYLLTIVGGFLDAYTFFERGGVFSNAQTGNIVRLGLALAAGSWGECLNYVYSMCAFTLGLLASLAIKELVGRTGRRMVRRSVLIVEIAGLAAVGLIPLGVEWDRLANGIVAFVAAMQYETFTTFRGEAILTTVSTGNLRKFVEALFAGVATRNAAKFRQAAIYASVIACFIGGAFLGARSCSLLGRAAITIAILALVAVTVIITVLRRGNQRKA